MRFWRREIAGWLLVAAGLGTFGLVGWLLLLRDRGHYLVEAGPLTFIGFIVFRGGIHLLKVAVAARVCAQAQERTRADQPGATARRPTVPSSAPGRAGGR